MGPLDDTMADLVLDALGGVLAAVFGPLYMRYSERSRIRVRELAHLLSRGETIRSGGRDAGSTSEQSAPAR